MQRFFSKIPTPESLRITIGDQPEFYHQVTRVLRMQVGDTGIFFEENGDDMVYIIESIDKKSIVWNRIEIRPRVHENLPNITLCQSLPNKLEKLEFILQKGVEVGVDQFVFFEAERSQKLPLLEKKKDRLAQIVTEAVEQSGGNSIPKIHYLKDTESAVNFVLSQWPVTLAVAHTDGQGIGLGALDTQNNIALFVGPEGGFAPSEIARFQAKNAVLLDFGTRILRTETVGMAAVFALRQG